ncbi:hypothetical protein EJB05_39487 [Eragrostis curvula]|uniref:RBR-type E3 ubiquitin transferase n=1 Tax=Eragrostis curvula TaxID=38414 RepID=A0A5J9TX16_9POAL|nr:hypothetical protein EJB05_39487 [Eragrostis curvula]
MEGAHGEREPSPEEREGKEARMLREMMLRARLEGEDPQVPDEQLRANDQLQQDEMMALEAIYGEDIGILGENGELQSFQSSALSHLGFTDGIVIQQSDSMMGPVDDRVAGEIMSFESVVDLLVSYNDEQCHESFLSGLHDCTICLSEYAGTDFIKLPCLHYYCRRCIESYSRMHVKEGTVLKLLCPHENCRGVIPPDLLKRLLGDADFEHWERLILQKTLDSMADVSYCPRCETACLEDEDNNAQCSNCFFSFCTHCRLRRHIGEKCVILTPEERLLSLLDRERVHSSNKGNIVQRINLVNEMCSIKELLRDAVPCPYCGIAISRTAGCSHMYCRNCGNSFCYDCGKALDKYHTRQETATIYSAGRVKSITARCAGRWFGSPQSTMPLGDAVSSTLD